VVTSIRPPTLSVYLPNGEMWALAWARFDRAHLNGEELTLVFADDVVLIRGQNLARVMEDVIGLRVECLRTIPATHGPAVNAREAFIIEIKIHSSQSAVTQATLPLSPRLQFPSESYYP